MRNLALLDILTNQCLENHCQSIQLHLTRLFNARQGSLTHLPDYGLPDVVDIYRGLPYSVPKLLLAMKGAIEKYEPRLSAVTLHPLTSLSENYVLQLHIVAKLFNGKNIQLETYFMSDGEAEVVVM